jgi:DnaJ-class molecular chaperone
MKDYYSILGVAKDATDEDIKKAYRKLASKHHPDKGGETAVFQEMKEAYDTLSDPEKRAEYDNPGHQRRANFTDMDEIMRAMREAHAHAQRNAVIMMTLTVDIKKAYEGAKIPLNINGQSIGYQLRAGLPPGVTFMDEVPVGDRTRRLQIQILVESDKFRFVRLGSADGVFFCGDLETDIEVEALDILLGGWVTVEDFLGKKLQVRVPAGFDLKTRLKVAKHGYSHWRGDSAAERGDLYLKVVPKFKQLKDASTDQLEAIVALSNAELEKRKPKDTVTTESAVTD